MVQYFCLKKECCIYFNSNTQNRTEKKYINFTSINFLNNEEIIDYNNNIEKGKYILNNDITPSNPEINFKNKDNNMSKSQFKEFTNIQNNYIDINNYYAPLPIEINDNIKESKNTNFNLLPINSLNKNEIKKKISMIILNLI